MTLHKIPLSLSCLHDQSSHFNYLLFTWVTRILLQGQHALCYTRASEKLIH